MPPKYRKISVPNFPYQVYTQVWDSTGKRSNILLPTQVVSSIADYKPKDGSLPTDGSPAYTTVFDSSTKTFYLVPIYSGLDAVKETILENLGASAPAATSTPTRSSLQAARRAVTTLRRLPISSMPANVQQYVDHVDENGNVFFRLPDWASDADFYEALQSLDRSTRQEEVPLYQSAPRREDSNVTILNIPNTEVADREPVLDLGTLYNLWAYPRNIVDVYNIHPEVYSQVLSKLSENRDFESDVDTYRPVLVSSRPLLTINGAVNDSTYHFIGSNLEDYPMSIASWENPAFIGQNKITYIEPHTNLDYSKIINNRVPGYLTSDGYIISEMGPTYGEVAIPKNGNILKVSGHIPTGGRVNNYLNLQDGILTAAQKRAYNNVHRRSEASELLSAPIEEMLHTVEPTYTRQPPRSRSRVGRVLERLFGSHKQGGVINYLSFFNNE